jgi:hypothetical protein
MPFVVDASVVTCWLLPDERHPVAVAPYTRIAADSAISPRRRQIESDDVGNRDWRKSLLQTARESDRRASLMGGKQTKRKHPQRTGFHAQVGRLYCAGTRVKVSHGPCWVALV